MMKGSVLDVFFMAGMVFIVILTLVIGSFILTTFKNQVNQSGYTENETAPLTSAQNSIFNLDNLAIFFVVLILISIIVLASMVNAYPAMLPFAFLLIAIFVAVVVYFPNIFSDLLATNSGLATEANSFPFFALVLNNLPVIVVVSAGVVAIVLYSRW